MRSLATWCYRHRKLVLVLWVLALVGATFLSKATGTDYSNSFTLPNTQSTEALAVLQSVSPKISGDIERIVFETSGGVTVDDPTVMASVTSMLGRIEALPHVTEVVSPYEPEGSAQISKDRTIAYATVTFDVLGQSVSTKEAQEFVRVAQSADGPNLTVAVAGQVAEKAIPPSIGGTLPGILLAGIVLLLVFGSLFAMALPLLSALASLGTAIGIIGMLSNVLKMPEFSPQLVLLIGLGVGIDYALFIVTRHRQGLIAGNDTETAVVNAVNTSGRAVLFAGIIVCIALLGMFALGVSFLYGLAVSASIGVAFTMLAALTLLPAMLGFIGPKVLSGRQRRRMAHEGPRVVGTGTKGFWPRWADFESRRPADRRTRGARHRRARRAAVLLDATRVLGRRERSRRHDHEDLLRRAREGLRPRVQRAAAGRRREPRRRQARRRSRTSSLPSRRTPDVDARRHADHAAAEGRHDGHAPQRVPDVGPPGRCDHGPHRRAAGPDHPARPSRARA